MSFDFMHQPGPCVICGDTNYSLSCGGTTICPKCDCGHFDAATVEKQAKVIASLRGEIERLRKALLQIEQISDNCVNAEVYTAADALNHLQGIRNIIKRVALPLEQRPDVERAGDNQ